MKKCVAIFGLLVVMSLISGCGIPKQMSKDCGGDLELSCRLMFGDSSPDEQREAGQNKSIDDLKSRAAALEVEISQTILNINVLSSQDRTLRTAISILQSNITNLSVSLNNLESSSSAEDANLQAQILAAQAQILAAQTQLTSLQTSVSGISSNVLTLQAQANSQQAQITELQLQDSVVDYLDCGGDGPGYDEVVMRTKSGKLVAYFESGSQRFLSILVPGSYQTTDASSCHFTVNAQMKFCDSLGCR